VKKISCTRNKLVQNNLVGRVEQIICMCRTN
jgi:hypothetical protein